MNTPDVAASPQPKLRLAYVVTHPIQYQAPLLRRIAQESDIDLTVFFGSDFSVRGYKDQGFGVEVTWDIPLLDGYRSKVLPNLRDTGGVTALSPISRGILRSLSHADGSPAFDALWVHGYATLNALHAIFAANLLGIPVLLRSDSWLGDRVRAPWKLLLKQLFLQSLRPSIAAILTIGSANAAYWSHYFGPDFPQFLLPFAVDNASFARRSAEAAVTQPALRAELHFEPDRPVILFASKLQTRKHCDHLVEAYAALQGKLPSNPYLVIAGDGEERTALEAQVQSLGLTDVRFVGFQNQSAMPRYLQLADVFVLPSRHEPWGLIVNEAMAAGCPVILSSDVGCGPDLITNGVEGFVYPVGNVPALTAALVSIFATPATATRMGEAARRRIHTWSYEEDVQGLRAALAYTTRKIQPEPQALRCYP